MFILHLTLLASVASSLSYPCNIFYPNYKAPKGDCSHYMECYNGQKYYDKCSGSKLFNPKTAQCEFSGVDCKAKAKRIPKPWPKPKCWKGGPNYLNKSPRNCQYYYKCQDGDVSEEWCGLFLHFNPPTSQCLFWSYNCNAESPKRYSKWEYDREKGVVTATQKAKVVVTATQKAKVVVTATQKPNGVVTATQKAEAVGTATQETKNNQAAATQPITTDQAATTQQTTTDQTATTQQVTTEQAATTQQTTTDQTATTQQTTTDQAATRQQTTTDQTGTTQHTTTDQTGTTQQTTTDQTGTTQQTTTNQAETTQQTITDQTGTTQQTTTDEAGTTQQTTTNQTAVIQQTTSDQAFTTQHTTATDQTKTDQINQNRPQIGNTSYSYNTNQTTDTEVKMNGRISSRMQTVLSLTTVRNTTGCNPYNRNEKCTQVPSSYVQDTTPPREDLQTDQALPSDRNRTKTTRSPYRALQSTVHPPGKKALRTPKNSHPTTATSRSKKRDGRITSG